MNQRMDFTRMVGTHFHHRQFVLLSEVQKRKRYTNMVVQIALRIEHVIAFLEHRSNEFLGGCLAVCTGNANDACTHLTTMFTRQCL